MNFCAGCLDPSVTTNKPEADGREVINLVSQDPDRRRNGYKGEYFIRPPVDITFEFKVPIDISHIKLNVKLEQKYSTGFVIFAQPEEASSSKGQSKMSKSASNVASSRSSASTSNVSSSDSFLTDYYSCAPATMYSSVSAPSTSVQSAHTSLNDENTNDVYFCVGKFFTQNEDYLILKNPYYKHWINMKMPANDVGVESLRVYKGTLKHTNRLALRCVKRIMIRILRTIGSAPPVLQAVEIWGQPGISTNKVMRKAIVRKWLDRTHIKDTVPLVPRIYNSEPEMEKQDASDENISKSKDSFEIPEDFLDPLTCDVMTVPLLQPSGHSIDAHTLERFIANEAIWGRPASDPFTGVPFKPGQMPSPNVPLKARIDRFLLMNADHPVVKTCGRTLAATTSGIQLARGLGKGSFAPSNHGRHMFDYSAKRKLENEDGLANKKYVASENENILKGQRCEAVKNKSIEFPNRRTSGVMKDVDVCSSEMNNEIKMSWKCKPKNIISHNCVENNAASNITESVLQNEADDCKSKGSSSHFQTANQVVKQIRKPPRHIAAQKSSSSHHGLIQMIGSALSCTRQRTVGAKSQDQRLIGKPGTLIHGDAKPKDTSVLDLVSKNSLSCHCGEKSELYKVPCNHVVCRKCLLLQQNDSSEVKCAVCGQLCRRSDVVKYHEKSIFSMS